MPSSYTLNLDPSPNAGERTVGELNERIAAIEAQIDRDGGKGRSRHEDYFVLAINILELEIRRLTKEISRAERESRIRAARKAVEDKYGLSCLAGRGNQRADRPKDWIY